MVTKEKAKEYRDRFRKSPKGIAYQKEYNKSEKAKIASKKWRKTPAGKEYSLKYIEKNKELLKIKHKKYNEENKDKIAKRRQKLNKKYKQQREDINEMCFNDLLKLYVDVRE